MSDSTFPTVNIQPPQPAKVFSLVFAGVLPEWFVTKVLKVVMAVVWVVAGLVVLIVVVSVVVVCGGVITPEDVVNIIRSTRS